MAKNRVFKPASSLRLPPRHCLTNAASTAREAGFNVQLYVESHLLRWYYIPDFPDEDGIALVGELLDHIDLVLASRVRAMRISYGEWLALRFEFVAQHRRRAMPEVLTLQSHLGPCAGDDFMVVVSCAKRRLHAQDMT